MLVVFLLLFTNIISLLFIRISIVIRGYESLISYSSFYFHIHIIAVYIEDDGFIIIDILNKLRAKLQSVFPKL